jgi:hypothetical protein
MRNFNRADWVNLILTFLLIMILFRFIQSETPVQTKGRALLSQDFEYFISDQILVWTRRSTYVAIKRLYKEVIYICCLKRFFPWKFQRNTNTNLRDIYMAVYTTRFLLQTGWNIKNTICFTLKRFQVNIIWYVYILFKIVFIWASKLALPY